MKKYIWHTGRSYDEIIRLLSLKTYTGFSKYDLVERYKCYPGRYGLYSNIKGTRLTVTIYEDVKGPWFNCNKRYFGGKIIEENGKAIVSGRFKFSGFFNAIFVCIAVDLFTGNYFCLEKHILTFAFVLAFWLMLDLIGCFAYRNMEKRIIDKLNNLFSPEPLQAETAKWAKRK